MKLYKRIVAGTLVAFVCGVPLKFSQTVYNDAAIISVDAASSMKTADAGISLIKEFEKCRLTAYKATSSETYYTIGWGHYGSDVTAGMTITQVQADQMFLNDLVKYENYVNTFLNKNNITVSQNQFDALVSFTYNCGNVWVSEPTFQLKTYLINGVNNYTAEQITTAFTNWNKQDGKVLAGLTRRRQAEAALFLNGSSATVLPGTPDTGYTVPITVTVDHKINTYNSNGSIESNRWIDAGDVCTINAVYTNGFVNVTYPVSGGTRTAYAKISDFTFSHSPNICVDSVTVDPGLIKISGWAFDEDNRSKSLDIHVYMDSDNKWVGGTVCQYDDEDALKGVVGAASSYKHRFAATFNTDQVGNHRINIAALDDNGGNATWSGHDVNIPADITSPTIKEVKISNQTFNGYTVTITATDNAGIKKVAIPTWTDANGQDDLFAKWDETALAAQIGDNTWEYYVSVSDHKNERGTYFSDVYVYDFAGNIASNHRSIVNVGMYDLTINFNGGVFNNSADPVKPSTKLIYNGVNWNSLANSIPKRIGYTFTGYFTATSNGTKIYGADGKCVNDGTYFKNGIYQHSGNLTVYAQWKANSYTVKFDANGGTVSTTSKAVTYDGKYGSLPMPTKSGYTFNGWYTAKTGGTKITADSKVAITANQTLYAQWKEIPVTTTTTPKSTTPTTTTVTTTADSKLSIGVSEITLINGEQYEIKANQQNLTYKSNNSDVAVVAKNGVITAVGEGEATISVINVDSDVVQLNIKVVSAIRGDANGDGLVTIADAVMLQKWLLAESKELTCWENVDLCKDNRIDVFDFCMLKRILVEK